MKEQELQQIVRTYVTRTAVNHNDYAITDSERCRDDKCLVEFLQQVLPCFTDRMPHYRDYIRLTRR